MQQLRTPLRVCRICGLEANIEAELEPFVKNKPSIYGHLNFCKRCHREEAKQRINRTDEFTRIFRARSPDEIIRCCFCGEEVTNLKGRDIDSLNIHSLDGDHENWSPDNKAPSHNVCHIQYHWDRRAGLTKALRTCIVCGLEAHTEEDLEGFVKARKSHSRHGRQNFCKPCKNSELREWRAAQMKPKDVDR